jgi:hypothetical protein
MEIKYNDNIYFYRLKGTDYEVGKKYAKLLKKRAFDIKSIHKIILDYKNNIEYDKYKDKLKK